MCELLSRCTIEKMNRASAGEATCACIIYNVCAFESTSTFRQLADGACTIVQVLEDEIVENKYLSSRDITSLAEVSYIKLQARVR